jgi:hypothetical protein
MKSLVIPGRSDHATGRRPHCLRFVSLISLCASVALAPAIAGAQAAAEPAPTTPPATPAAPPTTESAPAATATPPATPEAAPPATAVVVPVPAPPDDAAPTTASEAMPSTATEEKLPPINVAAWLRAGGRFQSGTDPKKLNDQRMDTIYGELHAGGKIHKNVSVTFNLNADGIDKSANIEDAIIGFDIVDEFHVWVGQELVPVDRANASGPFFMVPWNYPGIIGVGGTTFFMTPHEGAYGRNAGVTAWGDVAAGKFKYALGIFDNGDIATSPLVSGRVSAAFVGEETGYFGNASYFGEKNIFSLGLGGQYQHKGSVETVMTGTPDKKDYGEFNADLLGEFKLGDSGGWVTGDAGYYHFAGTYEAIHDEFYVLGAIASPKVGIGNIQPMVRYQYGKGDTTKVSSIDAAISYLIKGPALRLVANYQHADLGNDVIGNAVQLEAQAIFF